MSTEPSVEFPDVAYCRHCGRAIVWDDWCYVHLDGWANCRDQEDVREFDSKKSAYPDLKNPAPTGVNPYDLPLRSWSLDRAILDHGSLHQPIWL